MDGWFTSIEEDVEYEMTRKKIGFGLRRGHTGDRR